MEAMGEARRMPGSGSWIFTDAEAYEAALGGLLDTLAVGGVPDRIRLTQVELSKIQLLRAQESAARVALVRLPPRRMFITFPTRRDSLLICNGSDIPYRSIMLHGSGESFYQRITGPVAWGYVSLLAGTLARHIKLLAGRTLAFPVAGQILRPLPSDWAQLIRLHAEAGRIAETRLAHILHPEVARALEQDLIWTVVNCLTTARGLSAAPPPSCPKVLVRFEGLLTERPGRSLSVAEMVRALGVSEEKLRACCASILGMSPGRYQRLRRLKAARLEVLRLGSGSSSLAEVVRRFGFPDLEHFVREYEGVHGTKPF